MKKQRGFIPIWIIIAIVVSTLVASGVVGYGVFKYREIKKENEELQKLSDVQVKEDGEVDEKKDNQESYEVIEPVSIAPPIISTPPVIPVSVVEQGPNWSDLDIAKSAISDSVSIGYDSIEQREDTIDRINEYNSSVLSSLATLYSDRIASNLGESVIENGTEAKVAFQNEIFEIENLIKNSNDIIKAISQRNYTEYINSKDKTSAVISKLDVMTDNAVTEHGRWLSSYTAYLDYVIENY